MFKRILTLGITLLVLAIPFAQITQAQAPYTVVILVVDDFTGVDLAAINAAPPQPVEGSCAVSLEGQAFAMRGAAAGTTPVPHGEVVYAQLQELLTQLQAPANITLVKVDIQGYTTDIVAEKIQQAVTDNPADFYVANMSFDIIPCEFIQAFADLGGELQSARTARSNNRYRGIFQRAVIVYNNQVYPVNSQKYQGATGLDPLQDVFDTLGDNVIPIAAAGNFGLNYPFWPAAWPEVISVSASQGTGFYAASAWQHQNDKPLLGTVTEEPGRQGRVSNYGAIMIPGEYTTLSGLVTGTSFAAPRLSAIMALYLSAVGDAYCRNEDGGPALAYGDWQNLTLQEAVTTYCPDLQPYLPPTT
jgi:hypothetical protein